MKPIKKLFKIHPEYWIKRGYTESDAIIESSKYKGCSNAGHPNYYLNRKLAPDFDTAQQMASHWVKNNCTLVRNNMIAEVFNGDVELYNEHKKRGGKAVSELSYNNKNYWLKLGYSMSEAEQKIQEYSKKHSVRCIEYWINQGFTIEEAQLKIKEKQDTTSLNYFIKKYGNDVGLVKYQESCNTLKHKNRINIEYWIKRGYDLDTAKQKISDIQKYNSSFQPKRIDYWLKLGYNEHDAEIKRIEYTRKTSVWCKEYWLNLGYNDSESSEIITMIQRNNSINGFKSYKRVESVKSLLEINVSNEIINNGYNVITTNKIFDDEQCKFYFPDIFLPELNVYVEIYGDFWHKNPNTIKEIDSNIEELWIKDKFRLERIKKITNKSVHVWWESDILKLGVPFLLKKLVEDLNENC